jgi:hypothetical protein
LPAEEDNWLPGYINTYYASHLSTKAMAGKHPSLLFQDPDKPSMPLQSKQTGFSDFQFP